MGADQILGDQRFDPPNYTQVPNRLLDEVMPEVESMAELKVTLAIVRTTIGWHERERLISLSRIQELTGLGRQSAQNGLAKALERGYVARRPTAKGNGFLYGVRISKVDHSPDLGPGPSPDLGPAGSPDSGPPPNKERKTAKKNSDTAKTVEGVFDFWLSLDSSKNAGEYKLTDKRRKKIEQRLADSTKEEIAEALRGQWGDPWCQDTGKLDLEYSLRSRENLEDFRDRRRRQVGQTSAATSNGNGQPSAHPEYNTTARNPIIEAIYLIEDNGPRTANEVAQVLGRELEPTREMLMQMVEDGDCVYEASRDEAGEGTYARPGTEAI